MGSEMCIRDSGGDAQARAAAGRAAAAAQRLSLLRRLFNNYVGLYCSYMYELVASLSKSELENLFCGVVADAARAVAHLRAPLHRRAFTRTPYISRQHVETIPGVHTDLRADAPREDIVEAAALMRLCVEQRSQANGPDHPSTKSARHLEELVLHALERSERPAKRARRTPVSYTHLTLPTTPYV